MLDRQLLLRSLPCLFCLFVHLFVNPMSNVSVPLVVFAVVVLFTWCPLAGNGGYDHMLWVGVHRYIMCN